MKHTNFFCKLSAIALFVFAFGTAQAQMPEQQKERLKLFNHLIDIPAESVTAEELAAYRSMKTNYFNSLKSTDTTATNSIAYANGIINGTTKVVGLTIGELSTVLTNLSTLAKSVLAGGVNAKTTYHKALNKMIGENPTLFDKGTTYIISTSDYTNTKNIAVALPIICAAYNPTGIQVSYRRRWVDFCHYISLYGMVLDPEYIYNGNTDWMYNIAEPMFNFPFVLTNDETLGTQHLKACSRYMERFVEIGDGDTDGMKIDGTGFHHATHYPNYLYCFHAWHTIVKKFQGTPFKISQAAFEGGKRHDMCMYLTATKRGNVGGSYLANSLAGRNPYDRGGINSQVNKDEMETLLEAGKEITGAYDEELAQAYNYFHDLTTSKYSEKVGNVDGFYQFNYSPTGVLRKNDWVATMRAPTTKFWGSEQYAIGSNANRFGRYQSHGTLEIMYKGTREASGIPAGNEGAGWDWNVAPGTTTVHYTQWLAMMPGMNDDTRAERKQRFDQYNRKDFSGALAMGNTGIYATDFIQSDNWGSQVYASTGLRFKKSYFAFDSIIVALGSNIVANGKVVNTGSTATNLFQNIVHPTTTGKFIHNNTEISVTKNLQTAPDVSNWFVTPAGTGYYVPAKHQVTVIYGVQTSPNQNGDNYDNPTISVTAAKAYIDHGKTPNNETHEFVVIPNITSLQMNVLKQKLENATNPIYSIIRQDSFAHILRHNALKQTGYVVFKPLADITEGIITAIEASTFVTGREVKVGNVLVMLKDQGDTLRLSACSPDLNTKTHDGYGFTSEKKPIRITIKGGWACQNAPNNVIYGNKVVGNDTITTVIDTAQYGLTTQIKLYRTKTIKELPLSVNTSEAFSGLKVFPNPFHNRIKLELEKPLEISTTVILYNASGQLVKKREWRSGEQTLDLDVQDVQSGVYYLYTVINNQKITRLVMKNK